MPPTASGRMITKKMATSDSIARMSAEGVALFCLILPHLNAHGKMLAAPNVLKAVACPKVRWLTERKIAALLAQEITVHTDMKWFRAENGMDYIHAVHFAEHQALRRRGRDEMPSWPGLVQQTTLELPQEVPENSGSSAGGSKRGSTAGPDDAEKILAYWRAWVKRPTDKKQTLANIRKALKTHPAEALAFAIAKYKKTFDEERKDVQYLYKGSNFFGEAAYFEAFLPAQEELEDRRQEFRSALDTVVLGPAPKAAA